MKFGWYTSRYLLPVHLAVRTTLAPLVLLRFLKYTVLPAQTVCAEAMDLLTSEALVPYFAVL